MSAGGPPARIAETHISVVAMVGDCAYKLLKPVTLGFLDHARREDRERACHRETDLNRRFAPDVYLGVLDVVDGSGAPVDHLIAMRRMPDDRRLSGLLASPDAPALVEEVAAAVAEAHARAPTSPAIAAAGSAEAMRRRWDDDIREMDALDPPAIPRADRERLAALAREYLAGRGPLLASRREAGWVRDGHGDLLCDDVYCLDDGPRILDCLAFDDALRHGDVLGDVAFLAMDLEARGRPDLAAGLIGRWAERLGERHPASLAGHHVAHRAHVRAKVAAIRAGQGREGAGAEAARLHALALRRLERARVRLVLVGGAPGTGKSTLARGLAEREGWRLLRSDEVRKALAGRDPGEAAPAPWGGGIYAPEAGDRVYAALAERAAGLMAMGESVVVDASWAAARHRERARAAAEAARAPVVEVLLEVPQAVAAARIRQRAARGGDPSDATPEIAARLAAAFEPWPEAHRLNAARAPEAVLEEAASAARSPGP